MKTSMALMGEAMFDDITPDVAHQVLCNAGARLLADEGLRDVSGLPSDVHTYAVAYLGASFVRLVEEADWMITQPGRDTLKLFNVTTSPAFAQSHAAYEMAEQCTPEGDERATQTAFGALIKPISAAQTIVQLHIADAYRDHREAAGHFEL